MDVLSPCFWGFFCSSGNDFCPFLMDKYCKKYQQELLFDGSEYERCSRCLRHNNIDETTKKGSFIWAVHQLYHGNNVRRSSWSVSDRVYIKDGEVIAYKSVDGGMMVVRGYSFRLSDIVEYDWVIC